MTAAAAATTATPHAPLFVLRAHDSGVLSCAFYTTPHATDARASLLLSGDVGGVVLLCDALLRRPLLRFAAVAAAREARALPPAESHVTPGVLAVGFVACPDTSNNNNNNSSSNGVARRDAASAARVRFRLQRRPASTPHNNNNSDDAAACARTRGAASSAHAPLYFYTQCRDRCLYVWQYTMTSAARAGDAVDDARCCTLLHVLPVPQYGFCPVAVVTTHTHSGATTTTTTTAAAAAAAAARASCTHFVVPHDTDGTVSVWRATWRRVCVRDETENDVATATTTTRNNNNDDDDGDDDDNNNDDDDGDERARVHTSPPCRRVCAAYHARDSPLRLRCVCVCATVPSSVQAGSIMRLAIASDRDSATTLRLCVAFESGHVSLCEYGDACVAPASRDGVCHVDDNDDDNADDARATATGKARVLCAVRAFAESAMSCVWQRGRVVATSAEGRVHCYRVETDNNSNNSSRSGNSGSTHGTRTLQLLWQGKVGKGVGSVSVQGDLAILGAWDGTLRVYDVRSGALLSVLPFHTATVNDLAAPHRRAAASLSFAFDVRRPRCVTHHDGSSSSKAAALLCDAAVARDGSSAMTAHDDDDDDDDDGVYLCASASRDGTVAVWRIDFHCLP